jgi:hypothetical protein
MLKKGLQQPIFSNFQRTYNQEPGWSLTRTSDLNVKLCQTANILQMPHAIMINIGDLYCAATG